MAFAVKYYRSPQAAEWFKQHGIDKPEGWVLGQARFMGREGAEKEANRFRSAGITAEIVGAAA